ncbi:MAG: hypothetical protein KAR20_01910 [Candidatus Heimdallarchaeota archaeon]|nr:hypothetical protein [Candidatus Heimdallarchaeota archaeon]
MSDVQNNHLVLVFSYKSFEGIRKLFTQTDSISWLYLGKDFLRKRDTERELGARFKHINISKLHEEVANDLRHEYVNWIDDLNRCYGKNLEWWFNSISSRNVYSSDIFQFCCYLDILERLWEDTVNRPHLVFVESAPLLEVIQRWANEKDIDVKLYDTKTKVRILKKRSLFFVRWGHYTATTLLRWLAAFVTRIYYKPKKPGIKPIIIVDTFLHDYCLSDNGDFKDRYFPSLHEYLFNKGYQVLVHPVVAGVEYNYFPIYGKMRKSSTNFILREDFLHFSDYISAITYPMKVIRQKIKPRRFRNFNIGEIVQEELWNRSITSGMDAVLIYKLFLRIGQFELRPEQIINWYENQVIDKGLIAGARRAFPKTKIIGAQMFIHSSNFISLFPSQSEVDAKIVPDILLETSQHQCEVVQSFTKDIPCYPAGALRYSHLFNNDDEIDQVSEEKTITLLVLLPFSLDESVELLDTLKEAMPYIRSDIRILIKTHPDYGSKELIHIFGEDRWPERFEVFYENLSEAFEVASVAISSNSSSMVEAIAKGIPVIFLGRGTALNFNILSNLMLEMLEECYSTPELITAIEKYINILQFDNIKYKRIGIKVRDMYFEPVNEDTLLPFIGRKGK